MRNDRPLYKDVLLEFELCEPKEQRGIVLINPKYITSVVSRDADSCYVQLTNGSGYWINMPATVFARILVNYDLDTQFLFSEYLLRKENGESSPKADKPKEKKKGFHPFRFIGKGIRFVFEYR